MIHERISTDDSTPARRFPRDSVFIAGSITIDGQSESKPLRVRNLSNDGMMADCPRGPEKGQRVVVVIKRLEPVRGEVAWSDGTHIGVHFDAIIDTRAVRNVAKPREMLPEYLRPAISPPRSFR